MFSNKTRSRKMWAIALASFLMCAVMSAILPTFADEVAGDDVLVLDASLEVAEEATAE